MDKPVTSPSEQKAWLWPIRFPASVGHAGWRVAGATDRVTKGWRWLPAAVFAGTAPLVLGACLSVSWHQVISAFLISILLLHAVRTDNVSRGIGMVGVAFAAHCALAICIAYYLPQRAAECFPGGLPYWLKNLHWIKTGEDPEYVLVNWVPAHIQLFFVAILFSYISLGLAVFIQGLHEVDLMNFYVGRLLASSDGSAITLLLGWHPWSVLRGVCYALLIYEVTSLSLERLSGRILSTRYKRRMRWSFAVVFFLLDGSVKYLTMDSVRNTLASHLI